MSRPLWRGTMSVFLKGMKKELTNSFWVYDELMTLQGPKTGD